jgi:hypothetical protein
MFTLSDGLCSSSSSLSSRQQICLGGLCTGVCWQPHPADSPGQSIQSREDLVPTNQQKVRQVMVQRGYGLVLKRSARCGPTQ